MSVFRHRSSGTRRQLGRLINYSAGIRAAIVDDEGRATGVLTRMGPCVVGFEMTKSSFGAGDFGNIKPEWNFGDPGGEYNSGTRGFGAMHFFDHEPVANQDFTVTLTLTNVLGETDTATRTVRITPDTRAKHYIDPDIGSATPVDPSDPNDPWDTIANAWAGTAGSNLRFILTAGKTHQWSASIDGAGSRDNILICSSVKGQKATVEIQNGVTRLIGKANEHGIRDITIANAGALTADCPILDARYTGGDPSARCWVVDVISTDDKVYAGVTEDTISKFNLWLNASTTEQVQTKTNLWGGGDGTCLYGCMFHHGGLERAVRMSGDYNTVWDCELINPANKNAFARNGGSWLWVSRCHMWHDDTDVGGAGGTPVELTHNVGGTAGIVQRVVFERNLITAPYGTSAGTALTIGTADQGCRGVVVRNNMIDGGIISWQSSGLAAVNQRFEDVRFYNNTVIYNTNNASDFLFESTYHLHLKLRACLAICSTQKTTSAGVPVRIFGGTGLAAQNPLVQDNVLPVHATANSDIMVGDVLTLESWATWNARSPSLGTNNLAKQITLDGYYPPDDDPVLIVTMPPDMAQFKEDYYGKTRTSDNWYVGAANPLVPSSGGGLVSAVTESLVRSLVQGLTG